MTPRHRWHVEDSFVGCLPDGLTTFPTLGEALDFLQADVAEQRANGAILNGSLARRYFTEGARRIFIERCEDPACEWEETSPDSGEDAEGRRGN